MNLSAKFQLDQTTNDHWSESLMPTRQSFQKPIFFFFFFFFLTAQFSLSLSHALCLGLSLVCVGVGEEKRK